VSTTTNKSAIAVRHPIIAEQKVLAVHYMIAVENNGSTAKHHVPTALHQLKSSLPPDNTREPRSTPEHYLSKISHQTPQAVHYMNKAENNGSTAEYHAPAAPQQLQEAFHHPTTAENKRLTANHNVSIETHQ
jgi:hypothetical protein